MNLKRIAVIGAGTMGHGIAQVLAQASREVLLYDADPCAREQGLASIATRLRQQAAKGQLAASRQRSGHRRTAGNRPTRRHRALPTWSSKPCPNA